jgi:O-antigen/teichoic acid export membrane protein
MSDLRVDLGGTFVRGAAVRLLATFFRIILNIGATMVLARILTPEDYGVIAMVMVVLGFLSLFRQFGLSIATIQRKAVEHRQVSTLFWVNVAMGVLIACACAGLAPLAAWFYGESRVAPVFVFLGLTFIMAGMTAQHQALLKRRMRFGLLAAIDIIAVASGAAVAIILAVYGARHWALVGMQLVTAGITMAGVWFFNRWRPAFTFQLATVKEMLAFGGNYSGFVLMHHVTRAADRLLIGKLLGAGPVGLYDKACRLLLVPIQLVNVPIGDVTIPTLSRLQSDTTAFRQYFRRILNAVTYLTALAVALLVVSSREVIAVVLGDQWLEADSIFRVLAVAALIQPFMNMLGCALLSLGRAKLIFRLSLMYAPIFVSSFCISLRWGPIGVAWAFVLCHYLVRLPLFLYALRPGPLRVSDCLIAVCRPIAAAVIACEGALIARTVVITVCDEPIVVLAASVAGGIAVVALAATVWKGLRLELAAVLDKVLSSWRARRQTGAPTRDEG